MDDELDLGENLTANIKKERALLDKHGPPWPIILLMVLGSFYILYAGLIPNIETNRRIFSIVFIALWVGLWSLLLWIVWRNGHYTQAWCLFAIPVILITLFFVLVIAINL